MNDDNVLSMQDLADGVMATVAIDGQSCTGAILPIRFAHTSTLSVGHWNLSPKQLPQIQHRLRSTHLSKKRGPQITLQARLQPLTIHLRRVKHLRNTSRVNNTTLNNSIVKVIQEVWLKQQVRQCPCKMDNRMTITIPNISSLTPMYL